MNTALATVPAIGEDYTREKVELIKRTICQGATDDEFQLFLYTAKRMGLDPLVRQIHAVKRWNASLGREVMSIQTGIDGYRLVADRTGKLGGITDPVYDTEAAAHPGKATVTVTKFVEDHPVEFTASARWTEYVQTKKDGAPNSMWTRMPYLMLGKCAEALALRKAFPMELTGVYTEEEMGQASSYNEAEPQAQQQQDQQRSQATASAPPPVVRKSQQAAQGEVIPPEEKPKAEATQTPEQREASWKSSNGHDPKVHISAKQGGLLLVIRGKLNLTDEDLHDTMRDNFGVLHYNNIPKVKFNELLDIIDPDQKHHTNNQQGRS